MKKIEKQQQEQNSYVEDLKFLTPQQVRSLAETFGTPIFVYHERGMRQNASFMQSLPNAFGLKIRYSIKAQANRYILRLFDSLGVYFDASSEWEVQRALLAGITPSKILLTSQEFGESVPELIVKGVQFDAGSLYQLESYGRLFPNTSVSIRINPGFGSGLVNRLTSGGPHSSFGIWYEQKEEIKKILDKYNLKLIRLHTHIGSGHNPNVLLDCLDQMLEFSVYFNNVPTINLGGGYRVAAFKADEHVDHADIFRQASVKMKKHAIKYNNKIDLEIEPGTFMMVNNGSIISRIIDIVETENDRKFIKINSGLTEIIRPSFYGAQHPLVVVPWQEQDEININTENYSVVGHCCIAGDVLTSTKLSNDEYLSYQTLNQASIGDYLVVERGGGYCSSMAIKNFNSYPEAAEIMYRADGKFQLIRKKQTIEQVCQNEVLDSDLVDLNVLKLN